MIDAFYRMAQNNAWANETFYGALTTLPAEAFQNVAPGFFPSLSKTLNHIHEVDLYYLDALEQGGRGRSVYRRNEVQDMTLLAAQQADLDSRLIHFCAALTGARLEEPRPTERHCGQVEEQVSALLLHLFQHQIHHRGQAHVQLHAFGATPPQLDDFHLKFERVPTAQVYWQ